MGRQGRRGFTLIELLVVMVILAILAAIAIPRFTRTREQAYRNTMVADLKNLSSQQEIYLISNMTYASSLADVGASPSRDVTIDITEADPTGWAATAVHAGLAGAQCGVFYGTASSGNGAPALSPGVITCDAVP
jgi:prepilin-type N-terminal cleavage/methylation domain-containing protein